MAWLSSWMNTPHQFIALNNRGWLNEILPRRRLTMFIVIDWTTRMERITRRKEKGMAKRFIILWLISFIGVTYSVGILKLTAC